MSGKSRKKAEKLFELNSPSRPPVKIKEAQLRENLSSLAEQGKWQETLVICRQIGDKRRASLWVNNFQLKALEATSQHQALLAESELCLKQLPRDPTLLSWHAHALRLNGRVEESVEFLKRAVKLAKPDANLFNNLGSALKETGEFSEALNWFDRAIAMRPNLAKAHWNRSDLVEDTQSAIALAEKTLSSTNPDQADTHLIHFSLYRFYEKLSDFDSAFRHLELGNQLKRQQIKYESSEFEQLTNRTLSFFNADNLKQTANQNPEAKQPIFIFGLPRSGTTLVEQILASHSEVFGANELTFLNDASSRVQSRLRIQGQFPDWLAQLSEQSWSLIGQEYLSLIDSLSFDHPRVTDKSLMNYRAAGLIAKSLPQAKMIHVTREPMDVAFGCYRQVFGTGHLFSYNFEEIADTISDHLKLLKHWQEHLTKQQYYVLSYEALIENPAEEISRLLDFCELTEEPGCYTPEKTQRTVRTLSSSQVRKPINRSGLGGWKSYKDQLEPLRLTLESRGLI